MLSEKRLPMRHTREILRLHLESNLLPRQIARICKVATWRLRTSLSSWMPMTVCFEPLAASHEAMCAMTRPRI
jgi:hypothetical protein